jgi:4-aminobutyrate aminotransferase-like enzyme
VTENSAVDLAVRRRRALGPTYHAFYREPVHLVRGEGVWLFDAQGSRFLDGYNNVASVGHCHPHVVAALARQASLLNTHTRYLSDLIVEYAERLLATCPPALGHALFTCTGSEANDLAIRIARHATAGTGIIVTRTAYHGATVATAAISPSAGGAAALTRENRLIAAPDTYRRGGADALEFVDNLRTALNEMSRDGIKPAALMLDTAFSSDGIFFPPAAVLREAAAVIRAAGGLFIADEVQAGFGRLGSGMWGFQRAGLEPDIVTLGKPMGDGHPIGGAMVKPELVAKFSTETGYFNTFGGNPVSAAVGMAVLDVIERENLIDNARIVGTHLRDGLGALAQRHPLIGDVRGEGLCIGVELVRPDAAYSAATSAAAWVVNGLRERHILISSSGPGGNVLKIRPPLPFSRGNADQLLEALDDTLSDLALYVET